MNETKLTDQERWNELRRLIKTELEFPTVPGDDENLVEFGFDDLDEVEFIMCVEEEFEISIDEDAAQKLKTLRDYFNYLKSIGI